MKRIKKWVVLGIIIYVLVVAIIAFFIHKKEKSKNDIFYGNLSNQKSRILILYDFFERFLLTKFYLQNIHKRYEIYCPGENKVNAKKAMVLSGVVWIICCIEFFFVFLFKPSLLNMIISIILILIINNEVIYIAIRNTELKLLRQMAKFFTDVSHFYYEHEMVDLAIQDAIKLTGKEMRAHACKIYEILKAEDIEKVVRIYNETIRINYLKLFLSSCLQAMEYGDKKVDEKSIFQMNLNHLKSEILIEELKMTKLTFLFSGLIFITVIPILSLNLCKDFGISNIPELTSFYNGALGIGILILSILFIVICYVFLCLEREIRSIVSKNSPLLRRISELGLIRIVLDNYTDRFYTRVLRLQKLIKYTGEGISYRQFLVKQLLYATTTAIILTGLISYIHLDKRDSLCKDVSSIGNTTSAANETQIIEMQDSIVKYVNKFKNNDEISEEKMKSTIEKETQVTNSNLTDIVINEVNTRIKDYRNEYYHWYELVITIVCSVIAYHVPYLILLYKRKLIKGDMDQEIIQFQSIILMLMYLDNMSILTILENMEIFAVIFKSSIQECINDFSSGSEQALLKLKEKEPYEAFQRLVDNLLISDKIGIVKAFDEIAADRLFFQERRKQETEIILKKKSDNATFIAYFPFLFILVFYMIVPFVIQSMDNYSSIMSDMM